MTRPRIHLIAPAGNVRSFLETIGDKTGDAFLERVASVIGSAYRVTADVELLLADEDEVRGGRTDDARRAQDIQAALGDEEVRAIVAVRGGAWFARVLPRIDFSVLESRRSPVWVLGFSELTTLVNVVSSYPQAIGVLDMGPAFLTYGLRRYARRHPDALTEGVTAKQWSEARLGPEFKAYWRRVVAMIEGRAEMPTLVANHVLGPAPRDGDVRFAGGNLTVLSTLIGSRYANCVAPDGRWVVLEDFNDKLERFDRFLAHLTLADFWLRCNGVLLGDFHQDDRDLTESVVGLLEYHLPPANSVPVLVTSCVGHIWPMTPLPLNRVLTMRRAEEGTYHINVTLRSAL